MEEGGRCGTRDVRANTQCLVRIQCLAHCKNHHHHQQHTTTTFYPSTHSHVAPPLYLCRGQWHTPLAKVPCHPPQLLCSIIAHTNSLDQPLFVTVSQPVPQRPLLFWLIVCVCWCSSSNKVHSQAGESTQEGRQSDRQGVGFLTHCTPLCGTHTGTQTCATQCDQSNTGQRLACSHIHSPPTPLPLPYL